MAKQTLCDLCEKPIVKERFRSMIHVLFGRNRIHLREGDNPTSRLDLHEKCFERIMQSALDEAKMVDFGQFLDELCKHLNDEALTLLGKKYGNPEYNKPCDKRNKSLMRDVTEYIGKLREEAFGYGR